MFGWCCPSHGMRYILPTQVHNTQSKGAVRRAEKLRHTRPPASVSVPIRLRTPRRRRRRRRRRPTSHAAAAAKEKSGDKSDKRRRRGEEEEKGLRVVREVKGEGGCPRETSFFSPLSPFSPPQKSMLEAHIACSSLKSEIISPLLLLLLSFASDNDDVGDLCQNGASRCEYRDWGKEKIHGDVGGRPGSYVLLSCLLT